MQVSLKQLALLLILLALFFSFLSLSNSRPFLDEGIYLTGAWLIANEKIPYLDFFTAKPFGIFFFFGMIFSLFEPTILNARIVMALLALTQTLALFLLAKKLFNEKIALISAFFFFLWAVPFSFYWAVIEPFAAFFLTLAVFFLAKHLFERKTNLNAFLCGLFLGIAAIFKQTTLFVAFGLALFSIFYLKKYRETWPSKKEVLAGLFGFFLFPFFMLLYLFRFNAFNNFLSYALFPITKSQAYLLFRLSSLLELKFLFVLTAFSAIAFIALFLVKNYFKVREKALELLLLLFWFAFSLFNAFPFWSCCLHFSLALPAASIAMGFLALTTFQQKAALKKIFCLRVLVALIFAVSIATSVAVQATYLGEEYSMSAVENLALYINENSGKEEKIVVFPAAPEIYFLSKRQPAIKYFFVFLTGEKDIEQEMLQEIAELKPALIINLKKCKVAENLPLEINEFIQENYSLKTIIELKPPLYKFYNFAFIYEPNKG